MKTYLIKKLNILLLLFFLLSAIAWLSACGAKTYKITFDSQGGTTVREYENIVENEPNPTRDGYFFRGWYADENCSGAKVEFPFEAKKDTILYAKWEKDTRTPAEKYIEARRTYTAKFDYDVDFYFSYKLDTEMINVTCSYYIYSLMVYFRLNFSFAIGDLENGVGTITGTQSCNYSVELSSSYNKSVSVKCTYVSGTDWSTQERFIGFKANFVNKIPAAFEEFYAWCLSEYGLVVY